VALTALVVSAASAQDEVILTRQSMMAEGDLPFDAAVARAGLLQVAANLENFQNLFPADSNHPPTHATPALWSNRAAFVALANKMVNDARTAANATTNADALKNSPAFKNVQNNCNACHLAFRDF
jgi:cytochrome c556